MNNLKLINFTVLTLLLGIVSAGGLLAQNAPMSGENINLALGDLDPGQTVTITFDVTIDDPFPTGVTEVCNQGTVSGTNFSAVLTDDPDVVGATCTPVVPPPSGGTIIIKKITDPASSGINFNFELNSQYLTVNSPAGIAGTYQAGFAVFGTPLDMTGITGDLVLVDDGTGTTTDACEPLINGAAINGNIAVIDRGSCFFTTKVLNAQDAGAIAVIMINNVAVGDPSGGIVNMTGDPTGITIPSLFISKEDGDQIKAQLTSPGVNATMYGLVPPALFALQDGQMQTFSDIPAGIYIVSEDDPFFNGYELTSINFIDPDGGSSGDAGTFEATIDLDPGETVECTFTDTYTDARCNLDPETDSRQINTQYTLTYTLAQNGNPFPGYPVTFTVVSGPNAGETAIDVITDVDGKALFTYTGDGGSGTDNIEVNVAGIFTCYADVTWQFPFMTIWSVNDDTDGKLRYYTLDMSSAFLNIEGDILGVIGDKDLEDLIIDFSPTPEDPPQTSTMAYENDFFDLETGTIIPDPGPIPSQADFKFAYNGVFTPHAVIFQNQISGVQIAYSTESYDNVLSSNIASLTFTTSLIDVPFNQVAVIMTPEGNYFKVGFVNESDVSGVTFQWEQLVQYLLPNDGTFYLVNNVGESTIYSLDYGEFDGDPLTPVHATLVGSTGIPANPNGNSPEEIASMLIYNGLLYGLSKETKKLYEISKVDGSVTQVYTLNVPDPFRSDGMAYRPDDGIVYLLKTNDSGGESEIWKFNSFPSGNISYVRQIETSGKVEALTVHPDGFLYASDETRLYKISVENSDIWYLADYTVDIEGMDYFYEVENHIQQVPTRPFIPIAPTPVELVSFTAEAKSGKVVLNWETATEVNNYGFDVEKQVGSKQSTVGNWNKVGFVDGHGNSNSPKVYQFTDNNPAGGTKFSYRLKQIDNDGTYEYSDIVEVEFVPTEFALYQNYPNPFNPATKIKYSLPKESNVTIKVFDILGNKVRTLVSEKKEAGIYEVDFDGTNLVSGIYIYQMQAGTFSDTKKMLILK